MAVLYDWFIADSDEEAAATLDRVGGPGKAVSARHGLFGREKTPAQSAYPTVATRIDPTTMGASLETLLTGRTFEDIMLDPKWAKHVAVRNGGELLILWATDGLVAALSDASEAKLVEVSVPWSQTEEFYGQADPAVLAEVLKELAALSVQAREEEKTVYCWVSV